jgi:hypothetical protein
MPWPRALLSVLNNRWDVPAKRNTRHNASVSPIRLVGVITIDMLVSVLNTGVHQALVAEHNVVPSE